MEEMVQTLPQHTSSWSKGKLTYCMYEGFWNVNSFHEGVTLAQKRYKAQPNVVLLCSSPKTGTTWLKALAFDIVTRNEFDESNSPLVTTLPHDCFPHLELDLKQTENNQKKSSVSLMATHLPYASLPKSVVTLNSKIVYIYRNIKDVVVSHYHFVREMAKLSVEDAPFEEAFDEFFQGISLYGPYWDHILGYWKASLERPAGTILFLKYEDLKMDPMSHVKTLAEFLGYPFSREEENAGVIEKLIALSSFKNLSNLEVNKTGHFQSVEFVIENRHFFRKAKDCDWENYFTEDMKEKIDKLINRKLSGTGLILT